MTRGSIESGEWTGAESRPAGSATQASKPSSSSQNPSSSSPAPFTIRRPSGTKTAKDREKEATDTLRKAGSTAIAAVLKQLLEDDKAVVYASELEDLVWKAEDGGSALGRRKYTCVLSLSLSLLAC